MMLDWARSMMVDGMFVCHHLLSWKNPALSTHLGKICLKLFIELDCGASSHNLLKSLLSPLPGTNQYWCYMKNHGHDPCVVQTHDPFVILCEFNFQWIAMKKMS